LRTRTRRRLRNVAIVTVVAAAISAAFPTQANPTGSDIAVDMVTGGLSGFVLISLEILLQGPAAATLRRLPVLIVLGLRTVLYGAVFLGAASAASVVVGLLWAQAPPEGAGLFSSLNLLFAFGIGLGFNFVFVLRALLGTRTLIALVTGRYHQP
jgi:hypothetical protein